MSRTAASPLSCVDLVPCQLVVGSAYELRQQFLKTCAQIADERDVDLDVLVDLGRIDFDVDLFGVGRVGARDCR